MQNVRNDLWLPESAHIANGLEKVTGITDHAREWLTERLQRKARNQFQLDGIIMFLTSMKTEYHASHKISAYLESTMNKAFPQIIDILTTIPATREILKKKWFEMNPPTQNEKKPTG